MKKKWDMSLSVEHEVPFPSAEIQGVGERNVLKVERWVRNVCKCGICWDRGVNSSVEWCQPTDLTGGVRRS